MRIGVEDLAKVIASGREDTYEMTFIQVKGETKLAVVIEPGPTHERLLMKYMARREPGEKN